MYTILQVLVSLALFYLLKKYFSGARYLGRKPDLTGKYAVVTGGAGGIGREAVHDLARRNCRVVIADIVDASRLAR